MAWTFNEEKLRSMIEQKDQLHAALRSVTERRMEAIQQQKLAQGEFQRWQGKYGSNAPVPADIERRMELTKQDRERLDQAYEKAGQRFKAAIAAVDPLERFAREELGWQPEGEGRVSI